MTPGGALHGTGAQKAVGQIRYASALRSSRPVARRTVRSRFVGDIGTLNTQSLKCIPCSARVAV